MSPLAGCSAGFMSKSRCCHGICRKPGDLRPYLSPWLQRREQNVLWDQGLGGYSPVLPSSVCFPGTTYTGCSPGPLLGTAILQKQWDSSRVLSDQPPEGTKSCFVPCRAGPAHSPQARWLCLLEEGPGPALRLGEESGGVAVPASTSPLVWPPEMHAPLRVFTAIHIHDLLAHILSRLGINMKPFFRMKFCGLFIPILVTRLKMAVK